MEKLKIVLIGVVLLLAAAVVYGYVDDNSDQPADSSVTVVESPSAAAPPEGPSSAAGSTGSGQAAGAPPPAAAEGKPAKPKQGPKGGKGQGDDNRQEGAEPPKDAPAPASPGPSPSRAEFVRGAERICTMLPLWFAKRAAQIQKAAGVGVGDEEVLRKAAPPVLFETAREFAKLEPPAGDDAEAEAMVAALERAARKIGEGPASGLGNANALLADFNDLAKRYGLQRCSRL